MTKQDCRDVGLFIIFIFLGLNFIIMGMGLLDALSTRYPEGSFSKSRISYIMPGYHLGYWLGSEKGK